MNTPTNYESKDAVIAHKRSQCLDKTREGTTSTEEPFKSDASQKSSNQFVSNLRSERDPVTLTEEPSSPPPPRKKSATLITLPADDTGLSDSATFSSKTHARTNTFGTIPNQIYESLQPQVIKEEAETPS